MVEDDVSTVFLSQVHYHSDRHPKEGATTYRRQSRTAGVQSQGCTRGKARADTHPSKIADSVSTTTMESRFASPMFRAVAAGARGSERHGGFIVVPERRRRLEVQVFSRMSFSRRSSERRPLA